MGRPTDGTLFLMMYITRQNEGQDKRKPKESGLITITGKVMINGNKRCHLVNSKDIPFSKQP